jgi:hypothetical protein
MGKSAKILCWLLRAWATEAFVISVETLVPQVATFVIHDASFVISIAI